MITFLIASIATILLQQPLVGAFYLPGVAPHDYLPGEPVTLKVNKLSSIHTQLPFDYYSLKYCKPSKVKAYSENLGEFLSGDRIENSPYRINFLEEVNCNLLCTSTLTTKDAEHFKHAIDGEYHNNWLVDELPAASILDTDQQITTEYVGFPVGYREEAKSTSKPTPRESSFNNMLKDGGVKSGAGKASLRSRPKASGGINSHKHTSSTATYYIYNHVNLILLYHEVDDGRATSSEPVGRIVGFYVEPMSIKHTGVSSTSTASSSCSNTAMSASEKTHWEYSDIREHQKLPNPAFNGGSSTIAFTYGVEWRKSDIHWASRWDVYLTMNSAVPDKIHWFSIVNSLVIVGFLAFVVAMILIRTLHRDITSYNRVKTAEEKAEDREEGGWKLVHADVFRPPAEYPMLFCVCVGTGAQLIACAFLSIFFSAMGFLSPANRGSIMIGMLCFFMLTSSIAGFVSAYLFKSFALPGGGYQRCTLLTAFAFPGFCFAVFFFLDIVVWTYGSTGAVPATSMFTILVLWFTISTPLVFWGAYRGYKSDSIDYPVVTANIARSIPTEQPWYIHPFVKCAVGGLLPFGACFVELYFIMSSIWMDQYYYVFGFLLIVFGILAVTCAEMSIVLTYLQLCSEDYRWWWSSFITAGSTAIYVFCYSFVYFSRLESNMMVTYLLYFGYMTVLCAGIFLMTGTIGFAASFLFNYRIYGSIKVD